MIVRRLTRRARRARLSSGLASETSPLAHAILDAFADHYGEIHRHSRIYRSPPGMVRWNGDVQQHIASIAAQAAARWHEEMAR